MANKLAGTMGRGDRRIAAWRWKVLLVLTSINLLNFFDRLLVVPMFPSLQRDFHIGDFKLGILASVLLLVDCVTALPAGYWSDRGPRQKIMAGGVFIWSAATFVSGLAPNYGALVASRGLVGVGEGSYAPGGTAMITASFPPHLRARVQSIFSLGMMAGGVLGLAAGGVLAEIIGWRHSFMLVGLPGVFLALTVYRLQARDSKPTARAPVASSLLKIPAYVAVLGGGLFVTFSGAVFINWSPTFVLRYYHLSIVKASGWFAVLVVVSSALGVLGGGYLADRLHKRWTCGHVATVAAFILLATPFLYFAVQTNSLTAFYGCVFVVAAALSTYYGPVTAVIHDLTPAPAHGFAFGLYMFVIHFFGDATAPAIIGFVSDRSSLRRALLLGVVANFLSALCFGAAAWLIERRSVSHFSH